MKYLIGNHKMNLNSLELTKYFKELKKVAKNSENQVGVCVPYVYLPLCQKMLKNSDIFYGAENMFYKETGAYTGEISPLMLQDFNCELVIIGHSERRHIFNETNDDVNKKVKVALENKFIPILCIGETLDERNKKETKKVLKTQLTAALKDVAKEDINNMWFAYEPVWAIGTGVSATANDAETTIKYVKETIAKLYEIENLNEIIVLYGGSLNGKNVNEILASNFIDGGLIGGASLKVADFKQLIDYKQK